MTPRVLLQVAALLESGRTVGAVELALQQLALARVVHSAEPGGILEEALVGDDEGLLQGALAGLLLPPRLRTTMCCQPVLAQTTGVQKLFATVRAVEWLVVLLDVSPEGSSAVEHLATVLAGRLPALTEVLVDLGVSEQGGLDGEGTGAVWALVGPLLIG